MSGRIKLFKDGVSVSSSDDPPLGYEYDIPGTFDKTCGTYGLDAFQLPHPECPEKFVCVEDDTDQGLADFSACIDAMNCHMLAGMTTGVKAMSEAVLFVHQMVPHHQNAVNMAKTLLIRGSVTCTDYTNEDDQVCILNRLLRDIVNTQNHQIQQMRDYLDAFDQPQTDNCIIEVATLSIEGSGSSSSSSSASESSSTGDASGTTTTTTTTTTAATSVKYYPAEMTALIGSGVTGTADVTAGSDGSIGYSGSATGLEANLEAADCTAKNGCGVHIHGGTSCTDKASQGEHYFVNPPVTSDPWTEERYSSDASGKGVFAGSVNIGTDDVVGRAFIGTYPYNSSDESQVTDHYLLWRVRSIVILT